MLITDFIWLNAAKLRDLAAIVGAIGTVIGIIAALFRVRADRRLQREVNAKRTWASVLRLSFEHPEYAEPDNTLHTDPAHRKRYIWFVSNVMNAMDEILISTDDSEWRTTAIIMIETHGPWISTVEFQNGELPTYCEELRELINNKHPQMAEVLVHRRRADLQTRPTLSSPSNPALTAIASATDLSPSSAPQAPPAQ
jgi:hypothetical protein